MNILSNVVDDTLRDALKLALKRSSQLAEEHESEAGRKLAGVLMAVDDIVNHPHEGSQRVELDRLYEATPEGRGEQHSVVCRLFEDE